MSDTNINIKIEEEVIHVHLADTGVATDSSTHNHDTRYYTKAVIDDKLDLIHTAGEVINGHRCIFLKDGLAYKASNDNPECFNRVIGMSVNAALLGDTVNVKKGKVENPGWALTANALYFLGLDGQITTVPPTTGILQEVGYSVETDEFYININDAIRR